MKDLFDKYIIPILEERNPKTILEIGVLTGGVTLKTLEYCKKYNAKLTSLEPISWRGKIPDEIKSAAPGFNSEYLDEALVPDFIEKLYEKGLEKWWVCKKTTSLEYLSSNLFQGFDMYLIDGDHNYYTLYNELSLIHRWSKKGDIILMHDVGKWGHRDQYYDEKTIPIEYLYSKKQGLLTGIKDFIKNTTYIHKRFYKNHYIPFTNRRVKNWKYSMITSEQYGLGCLEKI